VDRPRAALPSSGGVPSAASLTDIAISRAQERLGKVGHLDDQANLSVVLEGADEDLMFNIERRIQRGRFQLPQLPSTSMAAIEMTNHPSTDIAELSTMISADPLLCSELLKTANSVLYAAHVPAETLHEAIMRVGMRTLRSLIFSVSMRGVILKGHGLNEYAEEVWRQALSIAAIARAIAKECQIEPEKAFMIGLLQDVGKIALLTMLREEVRTRGEVNPALVGKLFHKYHERAGQAMGAAWRLPAELTSVAGGHHDYHSNPDFPESAAFACLSHKLDLFLSLGDEEAFLELARSDMMDFLRIPGEARMRILQLAQEAYEQAHQVVSEESSAA
jgi:HD-like signal output (HDOD) protein